MAKVIVERECLRICAMSMIEIKPENAAIEAYYQRLQNLTTGQMLSNEEHIRKAFSDLLEQVGKLRSWTLVEELGKKSSKSSKIVYPDGTLRDQWRLPHGYWEAKDSHDSLDVEIVRKREKGYPFENIIFEDSKRAVLYQDSVMVMDISLDKREDLARLLSRFLNHKVAPFERFEDAVKYFTKEIPQIAKGLKEIIEKAHKDNRKFKDEFASFIELCRSSLNPNLSEAAVDEMLIQHMLSERLIRKIFQSDFTRRNIIANKVEEVIDTLSSQHFSRDEFLKALEPFYLAIEESAERLASFQERQHFINTVYERFFQGYSVKVADTHGIVYTPQEIVDFMCAAVEEVLLNEFGKKLGQDGVTVLDPATGTGNFIINLLNRVEPRYRREFYAKHLFANEVMLMPYYIAALNIEHAYYELEGAYAPFEGLCFVDTLDLAKKKQMSFSFMTEKNTERVQRQQDADITVIIGNPPYNVGQLNENDNNKNRAYEVIDDRLKKTYVEASVASLNRAVYDPYVKFFRWATDRLEGKDGIVCYVTNNSFVDQTAFDGMRKHLLEDFTRIYHLDLHGNVRQNPQISGSSHNVFGIQVGVGITVAIRSSKHEGHKLYYHRVPEFWRKEEKLAFLTWNVTEEGIWNALNTIKWQELQPTARHIWRVPEYSSEFDSSIAISAKNENNKQSIFRTHSLGVSTNRDQVVYDFNRDKLISKMKGFIEDYNFEVDRYKRASVGKSIQIDTFVDYSKIKWSSTLKSRLASVTYSTFSDNHIRVTQYRPFSKSYLYLDSTFIDRPSSSLLIYPTPNTSSENKIIALTGIGSEKPFMVMACNHIADWHLVGAGASAQCFPFYVYDEDGSNRRENITDWALQQFQAHYQDTSITKWDIFYYVYGLLHHPEYRSRYADNLKRELPRIPFTPIPQPLPQSIREGEQGQKEGGFRAFSRIGKALAEMHLNYETQPRCELQWESARTIDYRVEKMRPKNKRKLSLDTLIPQPLLPQGEGETAKKTSGAEITVFDELEYNRSLTLKGIPEEAFGYRLGNRSALEWVIDQYQLSTDARSGITSDPNQYSENDQYIVELVERVVWISVETVRLVKELGAMAFR